MHVLLVRSAAHHRDTPNAHAAILYVFERGAQQCDPRCVATGIRMNLVVGELSANMTIVPDEFWPEVKELCFEAGAELSEVTIHVRELGGERGLAWQDRMHEKVGVRQVPAQSYEQVLNVPNDVFDRPPLFDVMSSRVDHERSRL